MEKQDADYFLELQTQTGWGRTLAGFASWCAPEPGWLTLDVGCGPGLAPAIFSRMDCIAVGIDSDPKMFVPKPLHPDVAVADVYSLPLKSGTFDMLTATNLLFLLSDPTAALVAMKRVLKPGGKLALLNPAEGLSVEAATAFAEERNMEGLARNTLLNWAWRAEEHHRWTETETKDLYASAGIMFNESTLKVGPGFGRFSWGTT